MSELYTALDQPRYELIPMDGVEEQLDFLPPEATVTVTCSPRKGIEATLDLSEEIAGRGFEVVPHLAARMVQSEGHLDETLGRMAQAGIRSAFVVGGDAKEPAGPYSGSLELAAAIKGRDQLIRLGSTAYPEGHPQIDDETLMRDLLEKQRYVGYVATQMCFDPDKIAAWADGAREQGMTLPVEVGIPGVLDRKKLIGISARIGVGDSASFLKKNWRTAAKLFLAGEYEPTELVRDLGPHIDSPNSNLSGLHINTFNQVKATERWRADMLDEMDQVASEPLEAS